jgi:flagellar operon protein
MDDIQFKKNYSTYVDPAYATQLSQTKSVAQKTSGSENTFAQILRENIQKSDTQLTFSKHAVQRMDTRQIEVSPQLMAKMDDAVEKAGSKGVKEALILNGGTAFIVNVPSKTVVTTMSDEEMKENIFTNIDGAVIL